MIISDFESVLYWNDWSSYVLVSGSCSGVLILRANRVDSFFFPICPLTNAPGTFFFFFLLLFFWDPKEPRLSSRPAVIPICTGVPQGWSKSPPKAFSKLIYDLSPPPNSSRIVFVNPRDLERFSSRDRPFLRTDLFSLPGSYTPYPGLTSSSSLKLKTVRPVCHCK